MHLSRTRFHRVRPTLLSLLPCLLIVLSVLVSPAATASIAGEVDLSFQEAPLVGLDGSVRRVVVQPDGKMLIRGIFATVNGVRRDGIVRLNVDGTLDSAFTANTNEGGRVSIMALQANGKVIMGGTLPPSMVSTAVGLPVSTPTAPLIRPLRPLLGVSRSPCNRMERS